jgi:hypothetical protein
MTLRPWRRNVDLQIVSASLAEKRLQGRAFAKYVKQVKALKKQDQGTQN